MPKRYTTSEKWKDKWFRALSPVHKCLWDWLYTNCDQIGVIDPDFELASFQIGQNVSESDLATFGEERMQKLPDGRWWLVKFIEFQYGDLLNPAGNLSAIQKGILDKAIRADLPGYGGAVPAPAQERRGSDATGAHQRPKEKEKEKGKEEEKKEEGDAPAAHGRRGGGAEAEHIPPTLSEVEEYCKQRGNNVNPQKFCDFYDSKGWMIGKNKMKSWKAAVRTWEGNSEGGGTAQGKSAKEALDDQYGDI